MMVIHNTVAVSRIEQLLRVWSHTTTAAYQATERGYHGHFIRRVGEYRRLGSWLDGRLDARLLGRFLRWLLDWLFRWLE